MNQVISQCDRIRVLRPGMENELGTIVSIVPGVFGTTGPSYLARLDHDAGTFAFARHEIELAPVAVKQESSMASRALAEIQSRGVKVTIEPRSEIGMSGVKVVPRIALCGGMQRPGDYERLGRQRHAVIAILERQGAVGAGLENDGGNRAFEGVFYQNMSRKGRAGRGAK